MILSNKLAVRIKLTEINRSALQCAIQCAMDSRCYCLPLQPWGSINWRARCGGCERWRHTCRGCWLFLLGEQQNRNNLYPHMLNWYFQKYSVHEKRLSYFLALSSHEGPAFHQLHRHRPCDLTPCDPARHVHYFTWPSVQYSSICMYIDAKQENESAMCQGKRNGRQAGRHAGKPSRQGRQAGKGR